MAEPGRGAVLGLYRTLLRRARELRFTDRDFYVETIRREFRRPLPPGAGPDAVQRQLEKGRAFLRGERGRLV
ncbi:MIEF1 upstream open reading frame protein-like [Antechinus flavipes]|uniref:MIEF1 upstream open reading frame protein-like n=1 Tax=Antechinus flavipes TaxID=38775 RepID=UPI002235FDB0|nr:MIEF1 upstream open reading frame protein-like [Antechinus flavipes]